ncbi:MAG: hypothetical protein M3R15_32300, partial [Acidobacteriota bacterium]|nr:hypothetical protein [Acidobacteriota bacterium]
MTAQLAAGLGRANRPQTKIITDALCRSDVAERHSRSRRSKRFDRLAAFVFREFVFGGIGAHLAVCLTAAALCVATVGNGRSSSAQQLNTFRASVHQQLPSVLPAPRRFEYLWYEAENMRGIATDARHEPRLNPSWKNPPRAEAPGWGINGPGVSAEWSQGGESEWNSVAASADESSATIYQEIEIPRAGAYRVWVRYADWLRRTESFSVTITQGEREVFRRQFGARGVLDAHDETGMYWGWAFVWDGADVPALSKGAARIALVIEGPTEARRHVDCVLVTDDPAFVPEGRAKPPFAATRVLQKWGDSRPTLRSLLDRDATGAVPKLWARPRVAGRDFLMPWNISMKFWESYDKPPAERLLYPFHVELIDEFVAKYKGAREVPLFDSKMVVPVIYINDLATLLKEGSPFLRYLRETRAPFAVLINYGTLQMPEADGQAAWKLLTGELREQFIGWISGESIGYVYDRAPVD